MPPPLPDLVRQASARVAGLASSVRIDEARLASYAAELDPVEARAPALHPDRHYLGHGEGTLAFVLALDAVNFGSGYFPRLRKRPGMSGYFTVASALTEWFEDRRPLTPHDLADAVPEGCADLFGQDADDPDVAELMGLFARAWNDLGRYTLDRFEGSFVALVEAADGSAVRLAEILAAMPLFQDVSRYAAPDGTPFSVPFYKRAQLAPADLAVAFAGRGWGAFEDLGRLTLFADNLVPHVLRVDGVLTYDGDLAAWIDRGDLLHHGSREEVEIRACAVHAVERLAEAMTDSGRPVTPMGLDYLLWHRGQRPDYKAAAPRHRARTTAY